ncbi:putative pogo transposable element with krab domain [Phytophthora infestans]|uniref:Putative pogo transposable element with krab domain n=1 Tax=Phytophthora infestans TaxID=4787 RepID=A0A8S9U705_PHYIN|nr:putative pogo transposable element with krab domain [Phytophthora infestans]KAF4136459.1 putative pogo transposable element with krab domain [Phytophthora infestans]
MHLSLRRTTNPTTLTDVELVRRAVRFMAYLTHLKTRFNLPRTVLMDETAVWFEDLRCETVDFVGSRHVVLRSTGFASVRVTAVLAVSADRAKLPSLVI